MKKSILHTIIKEEVKKALNEAVDPKNWPIGFFEVKNTFQITPGGGWTVTFTQGQLLQVAVSKIDQSIQTITRYNALKGQWDVVAPPISGYKDDGGMFPIAAFGGSQSWTAKFAQNTMPMSKGQADSKANSMAKETTLNAKEAVKMLSTMPGNQMVKITIIK
jgi:hypothetical protein